MQKRLERKLMDARKAHSELRVVIRENLHLEQESTRLHFIHLNKVKQQNIFLTFVIRLTHRVTYLEDQCLQLRSGMVQIQSSLDTCLKTGGCHVDGERCESRAASSATSSGVFSDTQSVTGGNQR